MFCLFYKFRSFSLGRVFTFYYHEVRALIVEIFPARGGDPSCWMWILFMVYVESFSVDNIFRDQTIIYVEGFPVDILPCTQFPMS